MVGEGKHGERGRYDPKVGKGVFAVRLKKNNSNFVEIFFFFFFSLPASSIGGEGMHIGRTYSESSMGGEEGEFFFPSWEF